MTLEERLKDRLVEVAYLFIFVDKVINACFEKILDRGASN